MRQINEKYTVPLAGQGNIIRFARITILELMTYKANRYEDQEAAYRSFLHLRAYFFHWPLFFYKRIENSKRNVPADTDGGHYFRA